MINTLLIALGVFAAVFLYFFLKDFVRNRGSNGGGDWLTLLGIGFGTNFFDTLGIGSFAPTTAFYKFLHLVDDKQIPGTLNVGHTLPVITEAIIFITVIEVEKVTLISLLVASVAGAVLGAGIVANLPEKRIQVGMGLALVAVAVALLASLLGLYPAGGDAVGLAGWKLLLAIVVSFILGALMTIGVGFYAPCMALIYSLGMSPLVAFPVMMGSCAFLMPAAGVRFIRAGAHNRKAALALALGGIPGVLLAAFVITSLPLLILKWVVLVAILTTALSMFRSAAGKEWSPNFLRKPSQKSRADES
jgi:uncharacterized membrane protein YfcA